MAVYNSHRVKAINTLHG